MLFILILNLLTRRMWRIFCLTNPSMLGVRDQHRRHRPFSTMLPTKVQLLYLAKFSPTWAPSNKHRSAVAGRDIPGTWPRFRFLFQPNRRFAATCYAAQPRAWETWKEGSVKITSIICIQSAVIHDTFSRTWSYGRVNVSPSWDSQGLQTYYYTHIPNRHQHQHTHPPTSIPSARRKTRLCSQHYCRRILHAVSTTVEGSSMQSAPM